MMNRAEQSWPEEMTVEIPPEPEQHSGTLIEGLIETVETAEKGSHEKTNSSPEGLYVSMFAL